MLFEILTLIFLLLLIGMHWKSKTEGFENPQANIPSNTALQIQKQIRSVLDPMVTPYADDICSLFTTIRETALKNEKAGQQISDLEAERRVEAQLAQKIPGGALPCPLLTYPKPGSGDIEWLDFLQKVPPDFGARVVLMAVYAKDTLQKYKTDISSSFKESFVDICTPGLAETRRAEKAKKSQQGCTLPEDAKPDEIEKQVNSLLQKLVEQKQKILKEKGISLETDIGSLVTQAKQSQKFLQEQEAKIQSGDIQIKTN
jgi:hypothetical protein